VGADRIVTARLYLTVYAKDDLPTETAHVASKSLGTVNEALSDLQFRDELHGTGGIVARINRHHAQASLFVEDRYVLVHSDFGVIGGAFLREGTIDLSSNDGPGGEFMTWTGPGPMSILSNAVMDYDSNITGGHNPIDGYWDLSAQGPLAGNDNGHPIPMLKRALVEAQLQTPNAISVVDHSSWDYDADTNAAVPPTWTGSYGVNVGDDLLTIVGQFDQLGGVFFRMSHFFKLDAYLSFGTDLSGAFGAGTVRFAKGVNVAATIDRKVRGSVHVTHLIVGGAERTFTTVIDPDYVLGQVIRYGFLSVSETSDTSSLQEAGLAHIAARKRQTDAWTFPLHDHGDVPASGIYEPKDHYDVGDTVSLHTGTGEYDANEQAAPVAAIEWRLKTGREANGDYAVIPEIGSTFHWGGGGTFQGRDAPGSQHRICLCTTDGGTSEVVTGYEGPWTWDSGQETIAHAYPSGTAQMLTQDVAVGPEPGAAGTTHCGTFGSSESNKIAVTVGDVLRITGYVQLFGESFPTTAHGFVNGSWGVKFYTSGDVLVSTHTIASYENIAQDSGFNGPDTLDVTVPGTAAYMRFAQSVSALGTQNNATKIDQVSVSIVTSEATAPGLDDFTGDSGCAARCNHKHHAVEVIFEDGTTVEAWYAAGAGSHTHGAAGVSFTPTGTIAATNVQAAIAEVAAEAAGGSLPHFLPETYGAAGDDSTDDTTALQDALDAIDTAGGGTLLLSANYKITAELNWDGSGLQIIGLGSRYAGAMIRQATADLGVLNFNTVITSAQQSGQAPILRDFVIRGPGYDDSGFNGTSTAGDGIYCLADVILDNVGVEGFYNGVKFGINSYYSRIVGSFFYQNRNAGILAEGMTDLTVDGCRIGFNGYGITARDITGLRITNCSVEQSEFDNIFVDGVTGGDLNSTSVYIAGCYLEGDQSASTAADIRIGDDFDVHNVTIIGCNFTNISDYTSLILDHAQHVVLINNDFWQNSTGAAISSTANTGAVVVIGGRREGTVSLPSGSTTIDENGISPSPTGALDDLTDVTITAAATGDMLRYNGTAWVDTPGRWEPVTTNPGGGPEIVFDGDEILMAWVNT
jgi:hypothetical protein